MTTITTYLCNERLPIGEITTNYGAINDSEDPIIAKIATASCISTKNLICIPVISDYTMSSDIIFFRCIEDIIGSGRLEWSRKVQTLSDGSFDGRDTLITIEGTDPDSPCFWEQTRVYGITLDPSDRNVLMIRYPSTEGGAIPETKTDVCQLSGNFVMDNTQTNFVPGELLQLEWTLNISGELYVQAVAGNYFASPAVTGGQILSVPAADEEQLYDMSVQGREVKCYPTDFAGYVSGEWTYLLKQDQSEASDCNRVTSYTNNAAQLDGDELLRLVPMTVNSVGNATGNFETLDYNMMDSLAFGEFYETSLHKAVVQEVNRSSKTATIKFTEGDLEGSVLSDVSFFYHCEEQTTTDAGHLAFAVSGEVLVLNEGGSCSPTASDLKIVGFPDKPHKCLSGILIVSSPSENEAFAWDTVNNELLFEKDTYANIVSALGLGNDALLNADGTYSQDQYSWGYTVAGAKSLTLITPSEASFVADSIVVQHPTSATQILVIDVRAFGENDATTFNENRKLWQQGDYVVLSTTEGSSTVTLDSMNKTEPDASFDVSYCSVSASNAITQTWTLTVYTPPSAPDPDYGQTRWIYIQGSTLTNEEIEDMQYEDVGLSCYPLTPSEVTTTDEAYFLESTGFSYNVDRGNYFSKDSATLAPVVYHHKNDVNSYVPYAETTYETLTGVNVTEEKYLQDRARLFYFPLFSWPFDDASYTVVPFEPWLTYLKHDTLAIEKIFDAWEDCDFANSDDPPTTDAALNVTTGLSESTEHTTMYDAYCLSVSGEYREGTHVFHKAMPTAGGTLSTLEKNIFDQVNTERTNNTLDALTFQLNLQWAAEQHLKDMLSNSEYFKTVIGTSEAHTGTDGSSVSDRVYTDNEYTAFYKYKMYGAIEDGNSNWTMVGENLAYSENPEVTAEDFVTMWMNSTDHRDVILTSQYVDTGIAVGVADDGTTFACQTFGVCGHRWPGYSPMPKSGLHQYMKDNFIWGGAGDGSRVPKIYLT